MAVRQLRLLALVAALGCLIAFGAGLIFDRPDFLRQIAVAFTVFISIGIGAFNATKGYQYTMWIVTAVVAGMTFPTELLEIGGVDLRNKWLILLVVQLVMFGMGIQMRVADFSRLAASGKGVVIGLITQFTVMPLIGFILTLVFDFEPEIAAGVVLIGSCSSGLASNVMAYIAKANLTLSVTVTALTTIVAPIMTPFMMKVYAGAMVEVSFVEMAMEIVKIMIVPIGAALLHDYLKRANAMAHVAMRNWAIAIAVFLITLPLGTWAFFQQQLPLMGLLIVEAGCFMLGAVPVGYGYHALTRHFHSLDHMMPYFSMFGIVYFTMVTTAAGQEYLMQIGFILFLAAVIHNGAGYFLGYWVSKLFGLNDYSARAMALEIGLQNGGMASGLAGSMGKLGTVGLAAAVFSPWMNISGSILANYWRRKQERADQLSPVASGGAERADAIHDSQTKTIIQTHDGTD